MAGISKTEKNPIGEFYQYMALESIMQMVHSLSYDYIQDPSRYNQIPENIQSILSRFRHQTGSDPNWPDTFQRAKLYDNILGKSFWRICASLRRDAIVFSEQASGGGEGILRRSFEDELVTLRAYIETLEETSVYNSENQIRTVFENAVIVLRSPEIANLFHMQPVTEDKWPLDGVLSSKGAMLIEEISRRLSNRPEAIIPFGKFINLQRAAYYGKLTIMGVGDSRERSNDSGNIDKIIEHTYRWSRALKNLVITSSDITIKAWKDPAFRRSLSVIERSILPEHPSGQIDLSKVNMTSVAYALQTHTVRGEQCCSTGDLPCEVLPDTITCIFSWDIC